MFNQYCFSDISTPVRIPFTITGSLIKLFIHLTVFHVNFFSVNTCVHLCSPDSGCCCFNAKLFTDFKASMLTLASFKWLGTLNLFLSSAQPVSHPPSVSQQYSALYLAYQTKLWPNLGKSIISSCMKQLEFLCLTWYCQEHRMLFEYFCYNFMYLECIQPTIA